MKTKKRKKNKKATILVVDDEKSMRESMRMLLAENYTVHLARSGKEAIEIVKNYRIDLVLLDIRLPEIDGVEILKIIKGHDDSIEVIMVTAVVTVKKAVEAIRIGAYDYITKPFDIDSLQEQVEKVLEKRMLKEENTSLRKLIEKDYQFEKIVGKSREIRDVFKIIDDVAKSNATILISGESGTGKELVARAIHNRSPRKNKLFVAINCAAIPENLLESDLFGHERGSFTGATQRQIGKFEIANGGTLFLDEISSMPMAMQAKLLRTIQQREIERIGAGYTTPVDVRIISATNSNLRVAIKKYKFREDLYYRLNVIPIHLPPLRERSEDIPLLANHFINKYNREFSKKIKGIKKPALELLENYDWPGNIRELENLIERLMVLTKSEHIGTDRLPPEIKGELPCLPESRETRLFKAVQKFEADFIKKALEKTGGKKGQTAKMLGIHRNTLIQLERKLHI
ncbi:MAG: sigma-54-dependent Fis family transcriptional regulator [Candidatus Saganbacteria bacterium]|nr:sigma-54-dependent Fis family transcriptional regulator [Candidatus Saganbacteria bacterium]